MSIHTKQSGFRLSILVLLIVQVLALVVPLMFGAEVANAAHPLISPIAWLPMIRR
jgi:hypothetical protein